MGSVWDIVETGLPWDCAEERIVGSKAPASKRRKRGGGSQKQKGNEDVNEVPKIEENMEMLNARYRDVVRQMMFCAGDSEYPLDENVTLVYEMVRTQLILLLTDAYTTSTERGSDVIECLDLLFHMRRREDILCRLVKLAQAAMSITAIGKECGDDAETENTISSADDDTVTDADNERLRNLEEDAILSYNENNVYDQICSVIDHLRLSKSAEDIENLDDHIGNRRAKRRAKRTQLMDVDLYERFVEARTATFSTINPRHIVKRETEAASFRYWLGNPPLELGCIFVLSFVAKEVVTQIVDFASRIAADILITENRRMRKEKPRPLTSEDRAEYIDVGTLSPLHYTTALTRTATLHTGRNFLFGICGPPT